MRGIAVITALVAGVLSTAAMAQTSVPPALPANPTPGVAAPANAGEQTAPVMITDNTVICMYQRETGSLFTTRVCRTHRAWDLMRKDAQEYMDFGFRGSHQTDENSGGS